MRNYSVFICSYLMTFQRDLLFCLEGCLASVTNYQLKGFEMQENFSLHQQRLQKLK